MSPQPGVRIWVAPSLWLTFEHTHTRIHTPDLPFPSLVFLCARNGAHSTAHFFAVRSPVRCTVPSQTSARPHCLDEESEACRDSGESRRGSFRDPLIIGLGCTVSLPHPPLRYSIKPFPKKGEGLGAAAERKQAGLSLP